MRWYADHLLMAFERGNSMGGNRLRKYNPMIDHRRRQVAALTLRGLTMREIEDGLAKAGLRNERTGKPWDLKTIWKDVNLLREQWRAEAAKDMKDHQARLLAELAEVKRTSWTGNNPEVVLKAITQERAILGADAPQKVAQTTPDGEQAVPAEIRVVLVKPGDAS